VPTDTLFSLDVIIQRMLQAQQWQPPPMRIMHPREFSIVVGNAPVPTHGMEQLAVVVQQAEYALIEVPWMRGAVPAWHPYAPAAPYGGGVYGSTDGGGYALPAVIDDMGMEERRWLGHGSGAGVALGDSDGARLEERQPRPHGDQQSAPERAGGPAASRPAEPGLGGAAYGVPARLDGPWPAGRGQPQHPWEAPRTAYKVAHRQARLRALGNAVPPQLGYAAGCAARAILERIA
jgi:hypothetical protein